MTVADVVVIGAGPAGMAAAAVAAERGARVVVLDEAGTAGGQYLHPRPGRTIRHRLARRFLASAAELRLGATVWHVDPEGRRVYLTRTDQDTAGPAAEEVSYRALVLAPGAYDRPLAVPGWQLPGVVTAGAAQRLTKDGVTLGRRALVAGSGPFALPVALELRRAGVSVAEVAWTHLPAMGSAARHVPQVALEGAWLAAWAVRHRLRLRTGWMVSRILGDTRVQGAVLTGLPGTRTAGRQRRVTCDVVALGYGFLPQLALADVVGCELTYDRVHRTWFVEVDPATMRTSVDGVFAAGEVTGIGGHRKAVAEGVLAGAAAAVASGRNGGPAGGDRTAVTRAAATRRFAAAAAPYLAPPHLAALIPDETVVCRCENVTAATIRSAAADGATTVAGVRMRTRCGMGECQARMCGQLCGEIVEAYLGLPSGSAGRLAARTPARPMSLGELAA